MASVPRQYRVTINGYCSIGAFVKNSTLQQILPSVVAVVEKAGVLLAQEYARPTGREAQVTKPT